MAKRKLITIHCTDTPYGLDVDKGFIEYCHLMPRDLEARGCIYLGKLYKSRLDLPNDFINGVSIRKGIGNGWSRLGYRLLVKRDGTPVVLRDNDNDGYIEQHEMTWGATGINSISDHIVLAGGHTIDGRKDGGFDFDELYTNEQFLFLQKWLRDEIYADPEVKIGGHYQHDGGKTCPNFDVTTLCQLLNIPAKNIYHE